MSRARILKDWYERQPYNIKAPLTVLGTYLFMAILFFSVRAIVANRSDDLMLPYNNSNEIIDQNINASNIPSLGNTNYLKVLKLQQKIVSLRRSHHYRVSLAFFKNYYAITVCLMVISCIGGLLLFVLVNKGWSGSGYTLKVLFLSIASMAIFLGLFKDVFSQQKNYEDNMLRYMDYTKAELGLMQQMSELSKVNYYMTRKSYPPNIKDSIWVVDTMSYFRSLDTIIARNNVAINKLTDYIFTIDATKMQSMNQVYGALLDFKNKNLADTSRPKK